MERALSERVVRPLVVLAGSTAFASAWATLFWAKQTVYFHIGTLGADLTTGYVIVAVKISALGFVFILWLQYLIVVKEYTPTLNSCILAVVFLIAMAWESFVDVLIDGISFYATSGYRNTTITRGSLSLALFLVLFPVWYLYIVKKWLQHRAYAGETKDDVDLWARPEGQDLRGHVEQRADRGRPASDADTSRRHVSTRPTPDEHANPPVLRTTYATRRLQMRDDEPARPRPRSQDRFELPPTENLPGIHVPSVPELFRRGPERGDDSGVPPPT